MNDSMHSIMYILFSCTVFGVLETTTVCYAVWVECAWIRR